MLVLTGVSPRSDTSHQTSGPRQAIQIILVVDPGH